MRRVFGAATTAAAVLQAAGLVGSCRQYWEWSGRGLRPFDDTNEAYKLGVNDLMYGMTH